MKKHNILLGLCLALSLLVLLVTAGCGGKDGQHKVAASFANSSVSWQKNGEAIKNELLDMGYDVDIQYADTADQQVEQIAAQIKEKPDALVIGAVSGDALTDVLKDAKDAGIPVIAYDRLIMNTDAVSYYATFDNEAVGESQAEYIVQKLGLKQNAGPFTMEIFAGDTGDNNAHLFYSGAMKVLQPYIDDGKIRVPSGETSFDQVTIKDWKAETAEERMQKLLTGPDAGVKLDIILSPNDGIAGGIRKALKANGYTTMPLITGQDAEEQALTAIRNGEQAMTVYKQPEVLVAKTIRMIKAVVDGTKPDINNNTTYNNGVLTVPAYLCTPLVIDTTNLDVVK